MHINSKIFVTSLLLSVAIYNNSCQQIDKGQEQNQETSRETQPDTKPAAPVSINEEAPEKSYSFIAWPIKGSDSLKKAFKNFNAEEIKLIETINRTDKKHLPRIDTILIPSSFNDIMAFSPFPKGLEILKDVNKFVFFSYPIQGFAVYENGKLIKWGPTNMGKKATPTPTGLFFANWKGKEVRSSVDQSWILKWNFNIHNTGGIGWHEYALPGYPASHSCLRLLAEDAKWLYDWADQWILENEQLVAQGTATIVYGEYPWGERRPWKHLLENPKINDYTVEQMTAIIQLHIDKIIEKQEQRIAVAAQKVAAKNDTIPTTNQ